MKKNLLILMSSLLAMLFLNLDANAQAQDWYIRAGASGNYYWGEDDCTTHFKYRVSPSVNLTLGKWFNPYWGVQVCGNYGTLKGAGIATTPGAEPYYTADGLSPYTTGERVVNTSGETGRYGSFHETWNFFTIQPEIVYNASNGMCGYNDHRVWNVLVHVGPSYGHSYANGYSSNSFCVVSGITNTWRLGRNVQLWLDGRFTIFGKDFDMVTYRKEIDFMSSLSAGISFNFGK